MKNLLKLFSILLIAGLVFTGCSKDDDPADNNLFVGTYEGEIGYIGNGETINSDNGKVTVTKIGDTYRFTFNTSIPDISGIKFEKEDDNFHINVGGDNASFIRINEDVLKMLFIDGDETWTADCKR